ncbi:MAG: NAD-dependent epimerase/dehydratase family protein [Candidatus Kapaibacterium sp.]
MTVKGSKVLVLGGWGLVGSAIIHELMKHGPRQVVVTSLRQEEAEDAVRTFAATYPDAPRDMFVPWWGNVFSRTEWKDTPRATVQQESTTRRELLHDVVDELQPDMLRRQALYALLTEHRPDAVIDCINTATAIAYQDIYSASRQMAEQAEAGSADSAQVENLLAGLYIPQLVRHIQIMHHALRDAGVQVYLKVGTSGTGGMGLNIPYTHSEDKPSRVLLSKTALAGAQSMLLFLMARTPEGPIVKEVKPSAAIAWKSIAYGEIRRKGAPIRLVDMSMDDSRDVSGTFEFSDTTGVEETGRPLESVYIDTGENGIFSRAEFETVSSIGQMELVTPEEIAQVVLMELKGGNSGKDVIQGLDASVMGPTYRGGALRARAIEHLRKLERQHGVASIAFELLGPPRLTKLLYEAHLLARLGVGTEEIERMDAKELSRRVESVIRTDDELRRTILSVGLPVLSSDGSRYLRGAEVLIPLKKGRTSLPITSESLERWCHDGWVDLRPGNMERWKERLRTIRQEVQGRDTGMTGSTYDDDSDAWGDFRFIDEGKLAAYILHREERGGRIKR